MREADSATIEREGIESLELMERAAESIAQWICNNVEQGTPLLFVVGKGNNGGDGLSAARMLYHVGFDCSVVMPLGRNNLSPECAYNLKRLPSGIPVSGTFDAVPSGAVIIDALLGTGADDRPLDDVVAYIINTINNLGCQVISIDMPSGVLGEFGNAGRMTVCADTTLTLEAPKLAQLLPEAGDCCGEIVVLPLGLDAEFVSDLPGHFFYITRDEAAAIVKPRAKFSHKGTYGHTLLVCGSRGMAGAAILATGGALRSGCGLVSVHIPQDERFALHASFPSAIISLDPGECFSSLPDDLSKYSSVGVGPGLGRGSATAQALSALLQSCDKPMVIDADALNLIAENPEMARHIPQGSLLTPHPGELRRLVGEWSDERHKMELASQYAANYNVYMIVKGAHTMICTPKRKFYFNSTGTPAMAKGGSGDVLTGLLSGLLARGYSPEESAILGVYIHGSAAEYAADYFGAEAVMSSELIEFIPEAMKFEN